MKNAVKFIALSLYIFSASAVVHTFGIRLMFEENPGILLVILCIAAAVYRITEDDV